MSSGNIELTVLLICCLCISNLCHGADNNDRLYGWITAANKMKATTIRTTSFDNEFLNETLTQNDSESVLQFACVQELRALQRGIDMRELWALKFIDAWAKIPAGILFGHLTELGHYEECLSITQRIAGNNNRDIRGKYCLANLPVVPNVSALNLGICLPASCTANEMNFIFKNYLNYAFGLTFDADAVLVSEASCLQQQARALKPLDWCAICLLAMLAVLMLCSTCYDYHSTRTNAAPNLLLIAFSVRTNLRHLMRINTSNSNPNVIPCLHGIRCMALIWVIFGHCYLMMLLSPNINNADIISWAQSPFSMFLQSGSITVDTFFFLSGLLLMLVTMREMDRQAGKLKVHLMYLHRYLRLTPVVAVSVLLYMTLYRFMGNGPMWNKSIDAYKLCENTWWATFLYVQNYAAAGKMCLGHTWYLAVDMQFYLISPLLLIAVWKWQRKALYAIGLLGLLLTACLFTIIVYNSFIVFKKTGNLGGDSKEMRKIYYSTHTRASPWLIGLIFGHYLHKQKGARVRLAAPAVIGGWLICLSLLFACIFAMYPEAQADASHLTAIESAFYVSLSRVAWPLALCWLVFACINRYAGPVNDFLAHALWQPLSKLSYCMYIVHWFVETINAGRIKTNTNFTNYDVMLRFWGDFGITILASVALYLAVEAPMLGIEKFLFSAKAKERINVADFTRESKTISQQQLCD